VKDNFAKPNAVTPCVPRLTGVLFNLSFDPAWMSLPEGIGGCFTKIGRGYSCPMHKREKLAINPKKTRTILTVKPRIMRVSLSPS
jgi:hypothetical protein